MALGTPQSAILSAIIFNALIIPLLVPLALRGVRYRPVGATALLRRNLLIYGLGGLIAPFVGHQARGPDRPQPARRLTTGENAPRWRSQAAATTRSSSAWQPGSARPTECSRRGRPRRPTAATWSWASWRPRTRGDRRAGRGARAHPAPQGGVPRQRPRGDGPAGDLPARAGAVLIDELAHTNAPGVEHAKRYQDIEDVLDAGVDVYSTVNVQHLESLNDRVAELCGVRVRETFPDSVLGLRGRGGPGGSDSRGARSSACARARSTRRTGSPPRSTASSRSRTCPRCARSRFARWPRRSSRSAS